MEDKLIQLRLARDSVCMGDDVECHAKTLKIAPSVDTLAIIFDVAKKYLPTIAGRGHSWDCILNNENVAIVEGNCRKIKSIAKAILLIDSNSLYFKYNSATW